MTLKRRFAAGTAATLTSLVGSVFLISGPASANICSVTPKAGVSAVTVRNDKTTSASAAGTLNAGQYIRSSCSSESGGYYTACGATTDRWIWVDYGLFARYVAAQCVRVVVDRVGT
ncbi:hypothetical protein ONA91_27795 [Micromonospora sp. DR5-3]|uniref:hypothetical protein n=1 Tax=unclassified Micromonospora TaxID=2617518 RepID=UPI0011D6DF1B|nr:MULTISPECIES: hypothetical protein [unclassified Micromonospora]MCW3818259.1 hypothetical protein [Micromonospora sp. DR5-3]TYC19098.1 hypothetical protein FXF52_38455 [Micromonospora sp. MP36]